MKNWLNEYGYLNDKFQKSSLPSHVIDMYHLNQLDEPVTIIKQKSFD